MDAFWLSVVANIIAGVATALIMLAIPYLTRKSKWKSATPDRGAPVVSVSGTGNDVESLVDQSQTTNITNFQQVIHQNIQASLPPGEKKSEQTTWDTLIIGGVLTVVGGALFLFAYQWLVWLSGGFLGGILIGLGFAIVKSVRLGGWTKQMTSTVLTSVGAIAASAIAWVAVFNASWRGMTIATVAEAVASKDTDVTKSENFLAAIGGNVVSRSVELLKTNSPYGAGFVVMTALGVGVAATLTYFAWTSVMGWNAYVGSIRGLSNGWIAKKASQFEQLGWSQVLWAVIVTGLAWFLASGVFFQLMEINTRGQV